MEAARQCKRSRIPEVTDTITFSGLKSLSGEVKLAAYENAWGESEPLVKALKTAKSAIVAIGPEGGFSDAEMKEFAAMDYQPVTLGPRILRAETAAIYACAVISAVGEGL